MKKKSWKKHKVVNRLVGKCRYCDKDVWTEIPFVVYMDKTPAHYQCDRVHWKPTSSTK
tara:strand:+ start:177 stop:350 length:174 start_codon:yes stop_codon:yes gene_type:complete